MNKLFSLLFDIKSGIKTGTENFNVYQKDYSLFLVPNNYLKLFVCLI